MATWLLCDMNYLCHRARWSTGGMSHEGIATGVAFGVLRDLDMMAELHQATTFILAFDPPGKLHRENDLPTYKGSRGPKTDIEKELDDLFYAEMNRLKNVLLPAAGYRNIIQIVGYESDDVIAQHARDLPDEHNAVIISSDGDLYQCIRDRVIYYNIKSKRTITSSSFRTEFKIDPLQWAEVKAMTGCGTDEVPGIDGIGVKTAVDWLTGKLKPSKPKPGEVPNGKYEKILNNLDTVSRNRKLVTLPYPGLVLPPVQKEEVSTSSKAQVNAMLGIQPSKGPSVRAQQKSQQIQKSGGFGIKIPEKDRG